MTVTASHKCINSLQYGFDLGDGTVTPPSSDATVLHRYQEAGDYLVTVTVTDPEGSMDTASHSITVTGGETGGNEPGPGSSISASLRVNDQSERVEAQAPATLTFDASDSAYADAEGNAFTYQFVFGDEASSEEYSAPTTEAVVTHEYEAAGTYTAYVIVVDEFGNSAESNEVMIETTILITVGGDNGTFLACSNILLTQAQKDALRSFLVADRRRVGVRDRELDLVQVVHGPHLLGIVHLFRRRVGSNIR